MGGEMANVVRLTPEGGGELDPPISDVCKTPADADAPPGSIGQDLYNARQRSGKTLMDVWRETKIPPHHLIAIETSRFQALPGRVYAVGFVRSYSAYLGLDAKTFVARLRAEMGAPDDKLPVLGPLPPPERKTPEAEFAGSGDAGEPFVDLLSPPERKLQHSVIAGLLLAVLLYSGYYVLASTWRMAQPPPVIPVPARLAAEAGLTQKPVIASPLATVEQPAPALPAELTLAAPTEVATTPPLSVRPLATAEPPPALHTEPTLPPPTEVATTPPLSVRPLAAVEPPAALPAEPALARSTLTTPPLSVRPFGTVKPARALRTKRTLAPSTQIATTKPLSVRSLATVEPAPALSPELALLPPSDAAPTQPVAASSEPGSRYHAPLPLGRRYGMENNNSRIILRVHRSIRLAVQGTGNRIFIDRILDAGDTYRVPNVVGLQLSVPDGGAIEVILDDTTVGFAGKDGVMAKGLSLEPQSIVDRQQHG
jgi:cytoskeleton protein RodZ